MKTKNIPNVVILRSVLIGLLAVLTAVSLFCDYREQKRFRINKLRDQLPFTDLLKLESADQAVERAQLETYLRYFKLVLESEPTRVDAYAMSGFCYFHLGELDQAVLTYQKAIELKPGIFLFHYNLAVIFQKQGDVERAREQFRLALTSQPADNLDFIRNSKIFVYIIYKTQWDPSIYGERLKSGYMASAKQLSSTEKQDMLRLRIF